MKQYAIVKDVFNGEIFGYVFKTGKNEVAYGVNSAGRDWADSFNGIATKSLHDDLPIGVEVGRFGVIHHGADEIINAIKSGETVSLPEPRRLYPVGSESYLGDDELPSVKNVPLSNFDEAHRQIIIDYKARSFRADQARFNTLAKARFGKASIVSGGSGLQSKSLSEAAFEHSAKSPGAIRRVATELFEYKEFANEHATGWQKFEVEEKKLGPTIRNARRAAEPYDPNAIDGDEDGLVQDSTPFERPATPRARELGRLANQARQSAGSSGMASSTRSAEERKLNAAILTDRMNGMSLVDAAKKYGMTREDIRKRELMEMSDRRKPLPKRPSPDGKPSIGDMSLDEMLESIDDGGLDYGDVANELLKRGGNDNPSNAEIAAEARRLNAERRGSSGFKSTANKNPDTKNTSADNFDFGKAPGYKQMNGETRGILDTLEEAGFGWSKKGAGFMVHPPDRALPLIAEKKKNSSPGSRYIGDPAVMIHPSDTGKELASLKPWINLNFGKSALKDMKDNAKKKGELRGSGQFGEVESVIEPKGGFGSRISTPSAMRAAANVRAAERGGLASRRKKAKVPGIDRASDRDGQIWSQLDDEQRKNLAKAAQAAETELLTQMGKKFKNWRNGFIKDFRDGKDPGDAGLAFQSTEELLHFADFLEQRVMPNPDITPEQKLTIQRMLDNITTHTRMRLNDNYEFMEHLHEAQRKKVFDKAKGIDATIPSLGKLKGGGDSTFFGRAAGLNKETFDSVVAGTEDARLGRFRQRLDRVQKRLVNDILRPNPERQARRELRKAKRGAVRTEASTSKRSIPERVGAFGRRAKRRVRRALSGRKNENRVMKATDDANRQKSVTTIDGKVVIGPEGIARFSDALAGMKKGSKEALKDVSMKARGDDIGYNKEMALIWQAQGMNALPNLVTPDELVDLVEGGHLLIVRGHGTNAQNATDWLEDPRRYLPGEGGEAMGKGEYWSDVLTGGGWLSWMKPGKTNTVAVVPKNARTIDEKGVSRLHKENETVKNAWNLAKTQFPSGYDKSPIDEVVAEMKNQVSKLPAGAMETEAGQLWSQLLDAADRGDAKALDAMEMITLATYGPHMRNITAAILGYDAILEDGKEGETSGGRVLVMARNAVAAMDTTVTPEEGKKWVEAGIAASKGEAIQAPMTSKQPKVAKIGKAKGVPTWDQLESMQKIQGPLGSQGGQWYQDSTGQKYLAKPARSAAHASNEAAVAATYRAITGEGPVTAAIADSSGKPQILSVGLDVQPIGSPTPALQAEAKKNMGVDMLLSNWDAYGAGGQNVGIDSAGKIIRLDSGGGGRFRAQGGDKPSFSPVTGATWDDPASMVTSPFGQSFYGTVTNGEMLAAMKQVSSVDIASIDAALKAAGVDDETRKLYRDVIANRKREAVRYEALLAQADPDRPIRTTGSGAGATFSPG